MFLVPIVLLYELLDYSLYRPKAYGKWFKFHEPSAHTLSILCFCLLFSRNLRMQMGRGGYFITAVSSKIIFLAVVFLKSSCVRKDVESEMMECNSFKKHSTENIQSSCNQATCICMAVLACSCSWILILDVFNLWIWGQLSTQF